ncbi:hypothetical protein [Lysinibacillus sphaericus]|uniref:hypothetical protein n=1 Tax=Lysinibacillus sphaericus TaxID=1421 RepID=UPI003CFC7421
MKTHNEKEEAMKQALQLLLKLDEKQLLVAQGVMTGMILEHSLKEDGKGKAS